MPCATMWSYLLPGALLILTAGSVELGYPVIEGPVSENITVVVGQTAKLRCNVLNIEDGDNPTVGWTRNEKVLTFDDALTVNDSRMAINRYQNEWLLTIKYAQMSDAGNYTCNLNTDIMSNDHLDTKLVRLYVYEPVTFLASRSVAVPEAVPLGTLVAQLSATSNGQQANGAAASIQMYSVISQTVRDTFQFEANTGTLILRRPLDFERHKIHTLFVAAVDNGDPVATGTATFTVTVIDVNDNAPVFEKSEFSVTLPGDTIIGTSILWVNAVDSDGSSPNNRIRYSIAELDARPVKFKIDSATGVMRTTSRLDDVTADEYHYMVEAQDGGLPPLSAYAAVRIRVNIVTVKFATTGTIKLSESTPTSTVVVSLNASSDGKQSDGSPASIKTYAIVAQSVPGTFAVKSTSGDVLLQTPLDYEQTTSYNFTVRAVDNGDPVTKGTATLSVAVIDVNDHAPLCPESNYSVTIQLDTKIGASIFTVPCEDHDGSAPNNQIRYSIAGAGIDTLPVKFQIDNGTGVITTKFRMDKNSTKNLMIIKAEDGGIPPRSAFATVWVFVNTVKVKFATTGTIELSESTPTSTVVVSLNASTDGKQSDGSPASIKKYAIVAQSVPGTFAVKPTSGDVLLQTPLDYEQTTSYNFTVTAVDNGDPVTTGTTTFTLEVKDENDNAPQFPKEAFTGVLEDTAQAVGDDEYEKFSINGSTGVVMTTGDAFHPCTRSAYDLVIQAVDRGQPVLTGTTTVNICLIHTARYTEVTSAGDAGQWQTTSLWTLMMRSGCLAIFMILNY